MTTRKQRVCRAASGFMGTLMLLTAVIAYSQYLTLKKNLIANVSEKASSIIGQKVEIGDFSFSAVEGVGVHDIVIRNPEHFGEGDLLRIKKVQLAIRYRELFSGRFSFRKIEVDLPELSLRTDSDKRLNISDGLRAFLSKKGTIEYRIDEFLIKKAGFVFNNGVIYRVGDIDMTLNNLSSAIGTRSTVKTSMTLLGDSRVAVDGWAFLRDEQKKFNLLVSSDMVDLSAIRTLVEPYGIDISKSALALHVRAEGDSEKGVGLSADVRLKEAGFFFLKKKAEEIFLSANAFVDPVKGSIVVDKLLLSAGNASSMRIKGSIEDLMHIPSYKAEVKIDRLDLSVFNMIKGLKLGGTMKSDILHITGNFSSLPKASGTLTVSDGSALTADAWIKELYAKVVFSSDKEISAQADASAKVLKLGAYAFKQPAAVKVFVDGKGTASGIAISSRLGLSGASTELNGKNAGVESIDLSFAGTTKGKSVSGRVSFFAKGLAYEKKEIKDLNANLNLDYESGRITIKGLNSESEVLSAAAEAITVSLLQGGRKEIEVRDLSMLYPEQKAELRGLNCTVVLNGDFADISGSAMFSAKHLGLRDVVIGNVTGKGSINSGAFMLDVSSGGLFKGTGRLTAQGNTESGLFPLSIDYSAEHLDVGQASKALGAFIRMPYDAAGELGHSAFKGTMSSADSITGIATIEGKSLSVNNTEKKALLKNALVRADVAFRGKDLEFKADMQAGSLNAALSGTVKRFSEQGRSMRLSVTVPEARISDVRTAFWDLVPDRLLYTGLDGSATLMLSASYDKEHLTAEGSVSMRKISIEGENGEYSVGPVNGMIPFHYDSAADTAGAMILPSFERSDFGETKKAFVTANSFSGNELRIGSVRYGFRLLEDVSVWLEQKGRRLNIRRLSAKMFGGRLYGAAEVDLSAALSYRAGLLLDGISLTQLCEDIPPIKGYISGKGDGIAVFKGEGSGLAKLMGRADFWTYSDGKEQTKISKEFLEKIGGPQMRAYLGDRRFSKGIMDVYIQNGFLLFRELEISNRNFWGMTDLSVKVAPMNNRIAIDHLMWTITEAAQRAKKE